MRRIGCELGYNDGEVDNDSGCALGHCEGKLDTCRTGNRCRYVPVDGNENKLRRSKGDLGIKGFAQNYPSNKPHYIQRRGALRL